VTGAYTLGLRFDDLRAPALLFARLGQLNSLFAEYLFELPNPLVLSRNRRLQVRDFGVVLIGALDLVGFEGSDSLVAIFNVSEELVESFGVSARSSAPVKRNVAAMAAKGMMRAVMDRLDDGARADSILPQ
jgi:hypothetical protein